VKLAGTTALLTGATGGLGQAIARALANTGSTLLLSGRRTELLESLATELSARALVADLAERADVSRLVKQAGDIDVLVANAGLPASGDLLDYTPDQIDRALEVNLRAPIFMARELAPRMIERRRGHLAFVGSLSGKAASPGTSIYSATKFGLRGFAHGLRQDLYGTGVGVSVILPGFVSGAGMFAESGAKLPPGVRTVSPEEVALGVIRAIQADAAEVAVAPLEVRLGATLGGLAPGPSAAVQRLMGASRLSQQLAEGQRKKR
jgi:short-subunit dehydrogenase